MSIIGNGCPGISVAGSRWAHALERDVPNVVDGIAGSPFYLDRTLTCPMSKSQDH